MDDLYREPTKLIIKLETWEKQTLDKNGKLRECINNPVADYVCSMVHKCYQDTSPWVIKRKLKKTAAKKQTSWQSSTSLLMGKL